MKILLTQPITALIKDPPNLPDLGLGYIAARLRQEGRLVFLRDWNMEPPVASFVQALETIQPDMVGIKIFTKDAAAALRTIQIVRECLPKAKIVIGGPHPSCAAPEHLLAEFPQVDFAIKGEAEFALPELVTVIETSADQGLADNALCRIPGLVWRQGQHIVANPMGLVADLDALGLPAWDLIDPANYRSGLLVKTRPGGRCAPIITSRGCPGQCSFCSAHLINGCKIRFRRAENVLDEMEFLYKEHGVRKFMILDNCFTSSKERLIRICQTILERQLDIEWDCNCYERLTSLDEPMIRLMKDAGCRMIHMGIESGNPETRRRMHKASDLEGYTRVSRLARENGIGIGAWFMIGFPDETWGQVKQTIDYAFSLNADLMTFSICYPLPGSEVYKHVLEKFRIKGIDWQRFNILKSEYPLSRLPSWQLALLVKTLRMKIAMKAKLSNVKAKLYG